VAIVILRDHYGAVEVEKPQAFVDGALRTLRERYPTLPALAIPDVDHWWRAASELERTARLVRCLLPEISATDGGPEHAMIDGGFASLSWPEGGIVGYPRKRRGDEPPDPPETAIATRASGIAHVRVGQMQPGVAEEIRSGLRGARRGVILDLRGCGGGLLDESVALADIFLRAGPIVEVRHRHRVESRTATDSADDLDLPVVVLVDGWTAAGAEVVAAALRHHGRARLVGEKTHGAGIVKVRFDLSHGAGLVVPIAKIHAPDGAELHGTGLVPDVLAPVAGDEAVAKAEAILLRRR
jgi:hypothetical protein